MKKILAVSTILLALFTVFYYTRHPLATTVTVRGHALRAELAVTDTEKQKGLGGRDSLATDTAMLFVYRTRDRYGFWMNGMRFPLDFIWIDGNTVVDLSSNVPAPKNPTDRPAEISPKAPVNKVLEVHAGFIDQFGVTIGDIVHFTN